MKLIRTKLVQEIAYVDADSFEEALEVYNAGDVEDYSLETVWASSWEETHGA